MNYNELVIDEIKRLLADDKTRVILLTGEWGVGKTHLWKQTQKALSIKTINVSLFGVGTTDELHAKILSCYLLEMGSKPIPSIVSERFAGFKKFSKVLGEGLGSAAQAISSRINVDLCDVVGAIHNKIVVCIDDVERMGPSMSIQALFGLVAGLVATDNVAVVMICNDKQLNEEQKRQYDLYKERLVTNVFSVEPEPEKVVSSLLDGYDNDEVSYLNGVKSQLLDRLASIGNDNMRTLIRTVDVIIRIKRVLNKDLPPKYLDFLLALLAEDAAGQLRSEEFYSQSGITLALGASKNAERLSFVRKYFDGLDYSYSSALYQVVTKGIINKQALEDDIWPAQEEQSLVFSVLRELNRGDWFYYSDTDAEKLVARMKDAMMSVADDKLADLLRLLAFYRHLTEVLQCDPNEKAMSTIKDALARRAAQDSLDLSGIAFVFGDLFQYVSDEVEQCHITRSEHERLQRAESLRDSIAAGDVDKFVTQMTRSTDALNAIFEERIVDILLGVEDSNPKMFKRGLSAVIYELGQSREIMTGARGRLVELRASLGGLPSIGPFGRRRREQLLKELEQAMMKFDDQQNAVGLANCS